jgi:hypothetical protein
LFLFKINLKEIEDEHIRKFKNSSKKNKTSLKRSYQNILNSKHKQKKLTFDKESFKKTTTNSLPKYIKIPLNDNPSELLLPECEQNLTPKTNNIINKIPENLTIYKQSGIYDDDPNIETTDTNDDFMKTSILDSVPRHKYVLFSVLPLYLCTLLGIFVPHIIGK